MMTVETKDVRNETDSIILLPETQPHVVIFPAKPANLAELIIVAAELEQARLRLLGTKEKDAAR